MATHIEACKAVFRERVAQHFPQAGERFERYFRERYELIRALPEIKPEKGYYPRFINPVTKELNLLIALVALGVKPLAIDEMAKIQSLINKHGRKILEVAGLEICNRNLAQFDNSNNFLIYDPVLVAPILSRVFNQTITPKNVRRVLHEIEFYRPSLYDGLSELFGFPEPIQKSASGNAVGMRLSLVAGSKGIVLFPLPHYYRTNDFRCAAYSPEFVLPKLEAWATASAVVEEIRESPASVLSFALLSNRDFVDSMRRLHGLELPLRPHIIEIRIKRHGEIGDWDVTKTENVVNQ